MNVLHPFRINTPTVVSEVFEDEIVIIHLESGAYYSLAQSGAAIWQILQKGASLFEIQTTLATAYANTPAEIGQAVQPFMQQLAEEQLIVPDRTFTQPQQRSTVQTFVLSAHCDQQQFTAPQLNKFTDMQDLLLLDPIHDVTETGWPHVKSH